MPSIGHLAVGLAGARATPAPPRCPTWLWTASLVVLAFLPDADVLAFHYRIPYSAPFGHRGAFHSLAFALLVAGVLAVTAHILGLRATRVFLAVALVLGTHGLLDTLTDGGLGIAVLWPFTTARYFAPWRPIPVAPIGARAFSLAGLRLMAHEAVLFLPLFVAGFWPRGRPTSGRGITTR
jgi:inner membrane protein